MSEVRSEFVEQGYETQDKGVHWWFYYEKDGEVLANFDEESDTLEEANKALEDAQKQITDGKEKAPSLS